MKILSIISLIALFPILGFCQQKEELVRINTIDGDVNHQLYVFREFTNGKVISPDGSYGKAKLNFNRVTNEMLFIAPKGDTLKLAHPEATAMVTIATDTFYYFKNTFVKKITHYGKSVDLFQRQDLKHIDDEKQNAYGYSSVTANTTANTYAGYGGTTSKITEDRNLVFKMNADILVSNNRADFYPMKEAPLLKLLPKYKEPLKKYLETSKTNFRKYDDVMALMDYINKLPNTTASTQQ